MRRGYQSLGWIGATLFLAAAVPVSAEDAVGPGGEPPAMRPPVVTNPGWARRPAAEYPERALNREVESGLVRLECGFTADGALTDCQITEETPPGMGFGSAALRGVLSARLSPTTMDGIAANTRIRFAIPFSL